MLLRREHGKKGKTKEVGLSAANNKRVWNSHCQVLLLLLDAASRGSWGFFVGDSQAHTHTHQLKLREGTPLLCVCGSPTIAG